MHFIHSEDITHIKGINCNTVDAVSMTPAIAPYGPKVA